MRKTRAMRTAMRPLQKSQTRKKPTYLLAGQRTSNRRSRSRKKRKPRRKGFKKKPRRNSLKKKRRNN